MRSLQDNSKLIDAEFLADFNCSGSLSIRHEVKCEIGEVMFSYFLKEHDTNKGRYQLIARVGRVLIITCLRTNDRNWKDKFFFIKGELVYGPVGLGLHPTIGRLQVRM